MKFYLWGEINEQSTLDFFRFMDAADAGKSRRARHEIVVHSDGGCMESMMAIYDRFMERNRPNFTIRAVGKAYSAAAMLIGLLPCQRVATPNSLFMLHQGSYGMEDDYINQQESMAKFTRRVFDSISDRLAERIGKPSKQVRRDIENTFWMTAQDAVDYGLIDRIE